MYPESPTLARGLAAVALILLSGCASLDPEAGYRPLRDTVAERGGLDLPWITAQRRGLADTLMETLRAQPLEIDTAVQLALLNHPGLEADLAELGGAEAEAFQSALLRNPFLHVSALYPRDEHGRALDIGVSWDVLGLLALPPRREAADHARAAARLRAGARALGLAARTRAAWYDQVAEREAVDWLRDQEEAAALAAEVAGRLEAAGNLPPMSARASRSALLESRHAREDAEVAAETGRERLAALLGVGDGADLILPERLPRLPARDPDPVDADHLAARHLDIAVLEAELARARKLADRANPGYWTNSLELGWNWDREADGEWKDGPSLGLSLPLFDTGAGRRVAAEFEIRRLEARLRERHAEIRSEARLLDSRMRRARARVESLREELLPLLSDSQDAALLEYNAMHRSVFHLLDLKRRELAAIHRLAAHLADYWRARAGLDALRMGVSLAEAGPTAPDRATTTGAAEQGGH